MPKIHHGQTERDMTAEEAAQHKKDVADMAAQTAALEAVATAKASALAKLAALGLTDDEIAALLG